MKPNPIEIWPRHAIDIKITATYIQAVGLWRAIWATDIWINDVPVLKCAGLLNLLGWLLFILLQ